MGLPDGGAATSAAVPTEWRCRFCGTTNAAASGGCRSCGAAREAAASDAEDAATAAVAPPAGAPKRSGAALALGAALLVAALLGAAAAYVGLRRGAETVTVAGFEWERTVEVQDHETVREESWADQVPAGAQIIARRRELHHTERKQVGTRNGEPVYRERPVYRQRVAYDVERWSVARTQKAEGKGQSPRWPDIRLNLGEREGKRTESYVVVLQGRGVYRMKVPRERWLEMREGQMGTAVVQKGSAVLELR
jgi:hypothetical protein